MILIAIVTASMFSFTALTWTANRFLPFRVCPICAGVSATWLWMIVARSFGYEIDPILLATLMGGSVVGVAHAAEHRMRSHYSPLLWKALFIPAGFAAVYGIVSYSWIIIAAAAARIVVLIWRFLADEGEKRNKTVEELEKKMKDCC